MEKIEKKTGINMEYGLLGEKFDLFNEIARNQDDRWEKNQWNVEDFTITEHQKYICNGQTLIYCNVTNINQNFFPRLNYRRNFITKIDQSVL